MVGMAQNFLQPKGAQGMQQPVGGLLGGGPAPSSGGGDFWSRGFAHPMTQIGLGLLGADGRLSGIADGVQNYQRTMGHQQMMGLRAQKMKMQRAQMEEAMRQRQAAAEQAAARVKAGEQMVGLLPPEKQEMGASLLGAGIAPDKVYGLLNPKSDATSAQKEYAMAKEQGFQGSFMDYKGALARNSPIAQLGSALINDRRAQAKSKTLQMQLENQKRMRIESEAAQKRERAILREQKGAEAGMVDASVALGMIDDIEGRINGWTTGPAAAVLGNVPFTGAGELRQSVETLESQIALDKMSAMKKLSSTGATGFGALSEKELGLLTNSIASLKTSQGAEQLRRNLQAVRVHYGRFKQLAEDDYRRAVAQGYGQPPSVQYMNEPPRGVAPVELPQGRQISAPDSAPQGKVINFADLGKR